MHRPTQTPENFFSAGDARRASQYAPGIVSIWRKYVGAPGITDPIRNQARWLLDQYTAEIDVAAQNLGLTVEGLLNGITAIESLNEMIPTYSPLELQRAVEFDVCFAEETFARYGDLVGTVLLCGAIGNPHESEVHYMIPAAQAAVDYNGFLGYHPYWTRNETRGYLNEYWQWHAGRWMEWDKVFTAAGVYPRYALGEGGTVYAPDGLAFNSGLGWKACGSFDWYFADIVEWNHRAMEWNADHANRCAGIALFGYGNWGWDSFELGDGEVILLTNYFGRIRTVAPMAIGDEQARHADDLEKYLDLVTHITPEYRELLESELASARRYLDADSVLEKRSIPTGAYNEQTA